MSARPPWPGWTTPVLVLTVVIPGLALLFPPVAMAAAFGGWGMAAWVAVAALAGTAGFVFEGGQGCVLQGALPSVLRRTLRPIWWFGWLPVALGATMAMLSLALAAQAVVAGWRVLFPIELSRNADGEALIAQAVAALIAAALWRAGGVGLVRVAAVTLPLAASLAVILAVMAVAGPGAGEGLIRLLAPVPAPSAWALLGEAAMAIPACGLGCGLAVALGSRRSRAREIAGSLTLAVVTGILAVIALSLVTALAMGQFWPGVTDGWRLALQEVPEALRERLADPMPAKVLWFTLVAVLAGTAGLVVGDTVVQAIAEWAEGVGKPADPHHARSSLRAETAGWVAVIGWFLAIPLAWPDPPVGRMLGWIALLASAAAAVMAVIWAAGPGLAPLRRHLNAYSVVAIGLSWRLAVLGLVPLVAVAAVVRLFLPIGGWLAPGEIDSALVLALALVTPLATAAVVLVVLVARGPHPVDPNAVTMENFDPIDLDTDSVTRVPTRIGTGIQQPTDVNS